MPGELVAAELIDGARRLVHVDGIDICKVEDHCSTFCGQLILENNYINLECGSYIAVVKLAYLTIAENLILRVSR